MFKSRGVDDGHYTDIYICFGRSVNCVDKSADSEFNRSNGLSNRLRQYHFLSSYKPQLSIFNRIVFLTYSLPILWTCSGMNLKNLKLNDIMILSIDPNPKLFIE